MEYMGGIFSTYFLNMSNFQQNSMDFHNYHYDSLFISIIYGNKRDRGREDGGRSTHSNETIGTIILCVIYSLCFCYEFGNIVRLIQKKIHFHS